MHTERVPMRAMTQNYTHCGKKCKFVCFFISTLCAEIVLRDTYAIPRFCGSDSMSILYQGFRMLSQTILWLDKHKQQCKD